MNLKMKNDVPINIWDDYEDGTDTYAYIEDHDLPHEEANYILSILKWQLNRDFAMPSTLELYDSKNKYPNLPDEMHYTRWQLIIHNLSHIKREYLVEYFNSLDMFWEDKPIRVYSES